MKTNIVKPMPKPRSGVTVAAQRRRAPRMADRRAVRGNAKQVARQAAQRGEW
jgi:hypothetical protein